MRRLLKPAIGAVTIAAALTACSADFDDSDETDTPSTSAAAAPEPTTSTPTTTAEAPAAPTITIENFAFGEPLTVLPGATITVTNLDSAPHNVTALDDSFQTADLQQDETATFVAPTTPGTYEFTCTIHPQMQGQLIVSATAPATGGAPATTVPSTEASTAEAPSGGLY